MEATAAAEAESVPETHGNPRTRSSYAYAQHRPYSWSEPEIKMAESTVQNI